MIVLTALKSVLRQSVVFLFYTLLFGFIVKDESTGSQITFTIFFYVVATLHAAIAFLKMESDREHHRLKPWTWVDVITVLLFLGFFLVFQDAANEALHYLFVFYL